MKIWVSRWTETPDFLAKFLPRIGMRGNLSPSQKILYGRGLSRPRFANGQGKTGRARREAKRLPYGGDNAVFSEARRCTHEGNAKSAVKGDLSIPSTENRKAVSHLCFAFCTPYISSSTPQVTTTTSRRLNSLGTKGTVFATPREMTSRPSWTPEVYLGNKCWSGA